MKNITVAGIIAAPLLVFALAMSGLAAGSATTTCKDGSTTTSTGKGTCSGHGGIQKAAKAKPAAAAAAPVPAAAPAAAAPAKNATDPTGATAKCKDGTYSKSAHRSGTCSSHGGVAEWLTPAK